MRCTCPVFLRYAQLTKQHVQVLATRHNNTNTDLVVVEESTKCEQISVKRLILAIPLKIESDSPFDVVNLVRILLDGLIVHNERSAQFPLYPASRTQDT